MQLNEAESQLADAVTRRDELQSERDQLHASYQAEQDAVEVQQRTVYEWLVVYSSVDLLLSDLSGSMQKVLLNSTQRHAGRA